MRRLTAGFIMIAVAGTGPVFGKDIFSELMRDSVATFSDAGRLLYYSVVSVARGKDDKKEQAKAEQNEEVTPNKIEDVLGQKGIQISLQNQPIKRKEFAKSVMQVFSLETSFLTSLIGSSDLYFSDAVKLGLFSKNTSGEENLSTRELLQIYMKAESLGAKRKSSY
ncbi:MAG: hypothetical protein KDK41_06705 [Leptospiraceae bacterium]|nr:hypothetical protein [Leptospiraceae bacterium]